MEGFNPTPDPKEQMPPKRIEGGFNPSPNISNQIYLNNQRGHLNTNSKHRVSILLPKV